MLMAPNTPSLRGTVTRTYPLATKPSTASLRPNTSGPVVAPASSTESEPKRYSELLPSTNPVPAISNCALEPSAATDSTCTSLIVGRICRPKEDAAPAMRTTPVSALMGTRTCISVPPAFTALGRTIRSPTVPAASVIWNTTSVLVSRPLPCSVMVCPGLAEACVPSAGTPLAALATRPVKPMPNTALVPPTVLTLIGPVGAPLGTVMLMRVLWPKTSSP